MRRITRNEAGFAELFQYAKTYFGIEWNKCCDMFHRTELLNYRENTDFNEEIFQEEIEINGPELSEGLKIIKSFMEHHKVKEITIIGAGPS